MLDARARVEQAEAGSIFPLGMLASSDALACDNAHNEHKTSDFTTVEVLRIVHCDQCDTSSSAWKREVPVALEQTTGRPSASLYSYFCGAKAKFRRNHLTTMTVALVSPMQ